MRLYLIRHAHALDAVDDDTRELSAQGKRQITTLATFLAKTTAFRPQELWHSPLIRAVDTASQLARALRLETRCVEVGGLRPEDDPRIIAQRLSQGPDSLGLVGHQPHLGALASLLITGDAAAGVVMMEKAAVLALEGTGKHWAVRWHISPELLG